MSEKYSDELSQLRLRARGEAHKCCHDFLDVEHLVLALCKETPSSATRILLNMGKDPKVLYTALKELVTKGPSDLISVGALPETPRFKRLFEWAESYRRAARDEHVGTEHVLCALFIEDFDGSEVVAEFRMLSELQQLRVQVLINELRDQNWRGKRDAVAEEVRAERALDSPGTAVVAIGGAIRGLLSEKKLTPRQVNFLAELIANDDSPIQRSFIKLAQGVERPRQVASTT